MPEHYILDKVCRTDGQGFRGQLGGYCSHIVEWRQESKWDGGGQDGEGSAVI